MPTCFSGVQLFCDPMDCNLPGSSLHGILQARILEWVAGPSSRGSPRPGDRPISLMFPVLAGMSFTTSATWEACLTRYILSISYFISKSVWSKQVYFPLHMPWLMLRVDFLFVQQVTFMSKKIVHLGENWHKPVSVLGLLFFSLFITFSALSTSPRSAPSALIHF